MKEILQAVFFSIFWGLLVMAIAGIAYLLQSIFVIYPMEFFGLDKTNDNLRTILSIIWVIIGVFLYSKVDKKRHLKRFLKIKEGFRKGEIIGLESNRFSSDELQEFINAKNEHLDQVIEEE